MDVRSDSLCHLGAVERFPPERQIQRVTFGPGTNHGRSKEAVNSAHLQA